MKQVELKWLILTRLKIVPLPCENSFGQHVLELVFGVNVKDLNFWVQINPVKQPIQSKSLGPSNMSHCGTSTFDNHFDYRLIVLKNTQHSTGTRIRCILMEYYQCLLE